MRPFRRALAVWVHAVAEHYGPWRPVIDQTVHDYLACGDLQHGFSRVRCPRCHHEFFVAFSCRRRCLCPSCHPKRALMTSARIAETVCAPVPHRPFVFTMPRNLRGYFRRDRALLRELPRLAWETVREVYGEYAGPAAVPGMIFTRAGHSVTVSAPFPPHT